MKKVVHTRAYVPKAATIDVVITDNAKFLKHNIGHFDFSRVHYDIDKQIFIGRVSFRCENDVAVYPNDRLSFDMLHYDSFGIEDYGFKLELSKDNELAELKEQMKTHHKYFIGIALVFLLNVINTVVPIWEHIFKIGFLEFAFKSFWHFAGVCILLIIVLGVIAAALGLLKQFIDFRKKI